MNGIIEEISFYVGYPFVRYAFIVGILIALCSSLLGVTLVLKRFSFIGDGLSHVAFGAMAERLARQQIGSRWTFSGFLATPRNGRNAVLHIQDIQQN